MLAPLFRLSALLISGTYILKHRLHKDACAAGGVKYAQVCADLTQPISTSKTRTQQLIYRARDVRDDWLRCVKNTVRGAQTRIKVAQEEFVEVCQRIILKAAIYALPVGTGKQTHHFIDTGGHGCAPRLATDDCLNALAMHRVSVRKDIGDMLASECFMLALIVASNKIAIDEQLRALIGNLHDSYS